MVLQLQPKQPSKANAFVFSIPGLRGTARFSKKLFANEAAPAELDVHTDAFAAPVTKAAKIKETKAERAARLAAQSPDEKRQAELDRLAKQEARITARRAALTSA